MLKKYLKTAWRNALKHRNFTIINLISLIMGISLFFVIGIWLQDELSYDRFFPNADNIYRVESNLTLPDGGESSLSTVGWPVGQAIIENFAEVESLTYMSDWYPEIDHQNNKYYPQALFADQNFFNVFGYELEEGSRTNALIEPFSIVLTHELKEKFFGEKSALGETLILSDSLLYKVTGVLKKIENPSHLQFDLLGSFTTICSNNPQYCANQYASGWFDINVYNYLSLNPNVDKQAVAVKVENVVKQFGHKAVAETGYSTRLFMRPLEDIYLKSGLPTGTGMVGNLKTVRLFLGIGIFILLLACLNFINLSTASSMERAKEIGIKKVLGSNRRSLLNQFLMEAGLLCLVAAFFSMLIVVAGLPYINQFSGKSFTTAEIFSPTKLAILLGILAVLIPLAGFYPAWVMSSFQPIKVLKGQFTHSISGNAVRKGLVVFQFVISIAFIVGSLVVTQQLNYMQNENPGFDREQIILVDVQKIPWNLRQSKSELMKKVFLESPGIVNATAAIAIPGRSGWGSQFAYPEGKPKEEGIIVEYIAVDQDYVETLGLEVATGRDFIKESQLDAEESLIINETAVKTFGWGTNENAIGKKLQTSGKNGVVVGVLKDYHQHGLQSKINAIVLGVAPYINLYAVKYENVKPQVAVENITKAWNQVYQDYPLEYSFMDEVLQKQYEKEERMLSFFKLATFLSILIACLGLLGLSIYTAQKRIKEIGVRKVLGASVANIVILLSKDFLKLVFLAVVIAFPIAYYLMNKWLQNFAYRIDITWKVFALTSLLAVIIALLTVSYQAIKAALINPIKNLRSE